jgi:hypothetical protein
MHLAGRIGVDQCHERQMVILQPSKGAFRPPHAAYQAQDLSSLASRLPRFQVRAGSQPLMPAVRLDMITIRNGWFAIGDRLDGLVLTGDRKAVHETAMFTRLPDRAELQQPIDLPQSEIALDDVFLGIDGGWVNWYHWLCFALGRSAIAAGFLGNHTQIAFPEYSARQQVGFSTASWKQSLDAFGLAGKARFLPPGLYRAGAIRFFWTRPDEPTDLTYLDAFQEVFAHVRRGLRVRPDLPRRLLLSRARAGDTRIDAAEARLVEELASRYGFTALHPHELDFHAQAEALFNAECVIGVHGSGLTNILFGPSTLRVLELNLRLDGETLPRPWFYLLAQSRRQRYMMLDRDAGDLSQARMQAAIDALCNA